MGKKEYAGRQEILQYVPIHPYCVIKVNRKWSNTNLSKAKQSRQDG